MQYKARCLNIKLVKVSYNIYSLMKAALYFCGNIDPEIRLVESFKIISKLLFLASQVTFMLEEYLSEECFFSSSLYAFTRT